ncbi:MAG TPA: response regulator [Candidatus Acidoferrales bacterium]|nr:response regulator [Candidatus Acidoferrales bacterium]
MKLSRVLVVEDDADIQKVVRMSLKIRGVGEVVVVDSGTECLERLSSFTPDVILLDVMMPHVDGYEICRRLKENPATRAIPVVFLTARAQKADRERGMKLGAAGYVTKPFDPMTLHDQIVALVAEHSGRREGKAADSDQ